MAARPVDTSQQFCPHPDCDDRGWVGRGKLGANGHPNGGPWRQLYCRQWAGDVLVTVGTPLYGKRVSAELLVWAVGALADGLGIRAVARVFEGDANTVRAGLAAGGWRLHTAFIERGNLSLRPQVAAVGRRVMTRCKGEDGLRQQLALCQTSSPFCLPHARWRQPLVPPAPTNGRSAAQRGQPPGRRPARSRLDMAGGVAVPRAAVAAAAGCVSSW